MGTRSFIIQQYHRAKQTHYRGIYCHWDGYPSNNGKILQQHYSKPTKLSCLIGLGDISSLQPLVERDRTGKPHTIAYHRDRVEGRAPTSAAESAHLPRLLQVARESGCEYVYLFDGEYWSVAGRSRQYFGIDYAEPFTAFTPLEDVLAKEESRQMAR